MKDDDIDVFFEQSGCLLEALIKSRHWLKDSTLISKLDELIDLELDLAIMGANKAKSELLKANKESTVRPIK